MHSAPVTLTVTVTVMAQRMKWNAYSKLVVISV